MHRSIKAPRNANHPGAVPMCPLCFSEHCYQFAAVESRIYWQCNQCTLTFLSPEQRLDVEAELARYQLHQNSPQDPRYRRFLSRLTDSLVPQLSPECDGLDYGSGPGPTLSVMLEEQGFSMQIYDPYFAPKADVFKRTYDFITCTETVEHFYQPGREFQRLDRLLRAGGWLGVMTEMLESDDNFAGWWYPREPTHVCFYKRETMDWIANRHSWQVEYPRENVTLFYKPEATSDRRCAGA